MGDNVYNCHVHLSYSYIQGVSRHSKHERRDQCLTAGPIRDTQSITNTPLYQLIGSADKTEILYMVNDFL
jgi:hypothetical protein